MLKDVAVQANLSLTAVSLALRNHPRISKETRLRVQSIADKLGYMPDPVMSALASYRSRIRVIRDYSVIGLISNWSTEDAWTKLPSARILMDGAASQAHELGYTIQHLWAKAGGASASRFNSVLQARGIKGLIIAPFEHPDDTLSLEWDKYSVVTIERANKYSNFHHVVPNHFENMLLCWKKLREQNTTNIGLVVQDHISSKWSHQWEAAQAYLQTIHTPLNAVPTLKLNNHNPVAKIRNWLRRYRPKAVINRSEHFHEAAAAEGMQSPEDFKYISLNIHDDAVGVSGIDQQRSILGATAVNILHGLLQSNRRGFLHASTGTSIDGIWHSGAVLSKPDLAVAASK